MIKSTAVLAGLALATAAHGQFYTGFELPDFNASPAGVTATGQQGWYLPAGIGHNVHTYAGNAAGFVQNPVGGNQFIAGVSGGSPNFARAQVNHTFSAGTWTIAYDVAATFLGTAPTTINLSSFSLQHDTVPAGQFRQYIALNNFTDNNNPAAGWKAEYNVFNAAGGALNNQSPGAAWTNLNNNHWYRQYTTINLATNEITSVGIVDLHTGQASFANPQGWYMTGGSASTLALPNAVRFFVGGSSGNTMGWDNLSMVPSPGALAILGLGSLVAARRRRD